MSRLLPGMWRPICFAHQTQGSLKMPFSDCESSEVVEVAFASSVHKGKAKNEGVDTGVRRH